MSKNFLFLFLVLNIFVSVSVVNSYAEYEKDKVTYKFHFSQSKSDLTTALDKLNHAYENAGNKDRTEYWLDESRRYLRGAILSLGRIRGLTYLVPSTYSDIMKSASDDMFVAMDDKLKHARYNVGHKERAQFWIKEVKKYVNKASVHLNGLTLNWVDPYGD